MKKVPNFCTECKKEVVDLGNLLFVEESTTKGFCSEACILKFYAPYMDYFSKLEVSLKEKLDIEEFEDFTGEYLDSEMMNQVTDSPDDQLSIPSDIGGFYHLHVKYFVQKNLYYLIICTHYNSKPSFIFNKLITKSEKLVDEYRDYFNDDRGTGDDLEQVQIPDGIMDDLELKKSEHLALLLERRKDSDIPFETFAIYDDYLSLTLSDPDSVFHSKDEAGDDISNYIKSYKKGGKDFYYVVSCYKVELKEEGVTKIAVLPIISFPSIDKDLYQFYAVGDREKERLKN